MLMEPVKVRKVAKRLQPRLNQIVSDLIENAALDAESKQVLREVWIYPVDQKNGRAYYNNNTVTVPKWAFELRRKGFTKHYAAHELAHMLAHHKYGKQGWNHGKRFYECLKILSPDTLHYELDYKPKNAAAAGIKKPKQNGKI